MFLKRMRRRVGRKRLTYWALVESFRTERGPRQRVVAHLGELRAGERAGWAKLTCRLAKKDRPAPSLFDPPAHPEPCEERCAEVNLKGIRLKNLRDFGDVWLAWGLWRLLGLDELLGRRMTVGREHVPWPLVAAILTIARFCEPSSELHIEDVGITNGDTGFKVRYWWYQSKSLNHEFHLTCYHVLRNSLCMTQSHLQPTQRAL